MFDLFAFEYGWTLPEILDLTNEEVLLMQGAMEHRYKLQEKAQKDAEKSGGRGKSGPKKKIQDVLGKYKSSVVD